MRAVHIPPVLCLVLAVSFFSPRVYPQVQLNGWLSARYENGKSAADFPAGSFGWVRAGLSFAGRTATIFNYNLEVQLKSETQVEIEEAWLGINPSEKYQLKLGAYLVPFGRYNTANRPYQNPFIQSPLPQAYLYPESWRDIGLLVEGRWGSFGYAAYLGNGLGEGRNLPDGQQFKDNNGNKATGGRASVRLGQGVEVGGSYYRGKYDDANERTMILYGADASWSSQGFLLLYEYGKAELDNPADYGSGTAAGHFVLASLNISDITVLASYQTVTYDDPYHEWDVQPAEGGIAIDIQRWTAGLVYAPAPNFLIKVEYDFNREKTVELDNDVFLAQVSLLF